MVETFRAWIEFVLGRALTNLDDCNPIG